MTLFRKYYKDANNDINPSEEFINSVIENAHKNNHSRPPMMRRYTKYAASVAAALIIVSAAVMSMPVWQSVENADDGVISEEFTARKPAPHNSAAPPPAAADKSAGTDAVTTPNVSPARGSSDTSEHSYNDSKDIDRAFSGSVRSAVPALSGSSAAAGKAEPKKQEERKEKEEKNENKENISASVLPDIWSTAQSPKKNTASTSFGNVNLNAAKQIEESAPYEPKPTLDPMQLAIYMDIYNRAHGSSHTYGYSDDASDSDNVSSASSSSGGSSGSAGGAQYDDADSDSSVSDRESGSGSIQGNVNDNSHSFAWADSDGSGDSAPSAPGASGSGGSAPSASDTAEDNMDGIYIPAPSGYWCEYRSDSSASFVNDSGAQITVDISYSGTADSAPSYIDSGDSISVSMTAGGMRISIYASGADRSSVEEVVDMIYGAIG